MADFMTQTKRGGNEQKKGKRGPRAKKGAEAEE